MPRKKKVIESPDRDKAEDVSMRSAVYTLADLDPKREYFKTGIPQIDHRLGGIPKGANVQVGAEPGAGKTTLVTEMAIGALAFLPEIYKIGICDFENRMNKHMLVQHCKRYGVNMDRVLFKQPESGQDGLEQMLEWIEDPYVVMIVADSTKAIVNEKNIQKSMNEGVDGRTNIKLVNDFLEKIVARVNHLNKTILWIDHLKKKSLPFPVGAYTWDTVSGVSIKFYCSAIWFMRRNKWIEIKNKTERVGSEVDLVVQKTTVSPMLKMKDLNIRFGVGIAGVFKYYANKAIEYGYLEVKGKTISYNNDKVATSGKTLFKWTQDKGSKVWKALVKKIDELEKEKFEHRMENPPELPSEYTL